MLFELNEPAFVDGQYIAATVQFPVKLNIPDDRTDLVSVQWRALDAAAIKAQAELAKKKSVRIAPSVGRSNVAVAGGKKVSGGVSVVDEKTVETPVIDLAKNPIGA